MKSNCKTDLQKQWEIDVFSSLVLSLTLNVDYISRDGKIYTCKECEYTSIELTNIR